MVFIHAKGMNENRLIIYFDTKIAFETLIHFINIQYLIYKTHQ